MRKLIVLVALIDNVWNSAYIKWLIREGFNFFPLVLEDNLPQWIQSEPVPFHRYTNHPYDNTK